jgi:hypothetical protein
MSILGRQPTFWVGLIVTIILGVVRTLSGEGVISIDSADQLVNVTNSIGDLLLTFVPLITTMILRPAVTPVAAPKLEVGTRVLLDKPPGTPEDTPPPDGLVVSVTPGG